MIFSTCTKLIGLPLIYLESKPTSKESDFKVVDLQIESDIEADMQFKLIDRDSKRGKWLKTSSGIWPVILLLEISETLIA